LPHEEAVLLEVFADYAFIDCGHEFSLLGLREGRDTEGKNLPTQLIPA
jgi:hypothetical protein